jgi:hypothetical protein
MRERGERCALMFWLRLHMLSGLADLGGWGRGIANRGCVVVLYGDRKWRERGRVGRMLEVGDGEFVQWGLVLR